MADYIFTDIDTIWKESPQVPPAPVIQPDNLDSSHPEASLLLGIIPNQTAELPLVDENYINERRIRTLQSQLTPKLLNLITESDFEYGIESETDVFILKEMGKNSLATKNWLNNIFIEYFANPLIIIGILHIISRLPYYDVLPEGQLMATTALSHSNVEVQECGVRAFESWGTLHSLRILKNVTVSTSWLQDYINEVVKDLSREQNVPIG